MLKLVKIINFPKFRDIFAWKKRCSYHKSDDIIGACRKKRSHPRFQDDDGARGFILYKISGFFEKLSIKKLFFEEEKIENRKITVILPKLYSTLHRLMKALPNSPLHVGHQNYPWARHGHQNYPWARHSLGLMSVSAPLAIDSWQHDLIARQSNWTISEFHGNYDF